MQYQLNVKSTKILKNLEGTNFNLSDFVGGPSQQAIQNTNAAAGPGGTAIGSGEATANMALPAGGGAAPCFPGSAYWPQCQWWPPGGGGSNVAQQTTNAQAGPGGTAIGSGTATANMAGGCQLSDNSVIVCSISSYSIP